MPLIQPTSGDLHVNKMLTNILIGYSNEAFIADQIFPVVPVSKQTDIIPSVNQDFFFRDDAGVVAEGDLAPQVGYEVTKTDTYYCLPYGVRHFISDQRRSNEDDPFDSDREATKLLADKMLLRRERSFVDDFWTTGVWDTDVTGGSTVTKWSDFGSSTPIEDIRTYKRTVRRLIGADPNTLVLGDLTFDKLCDHPSFIDRIKYGANPTNPAQVTEAAMASVFGVERLLVGKSIYTSSAESASSITYSANWDDDALLLYVNPAPSIMRPSAGYTFTWKFTAEGNQAGLQWSRKWRDNARLGDWLEVRSSYDQKSCVSAAGAFFDDLVDA